MAFGIARVPTETFHSQNSILNREVRRWLADTQRGVHATSASPAPSSSSFTGETQLRRRLRRIRLALPFVSAAERKGRIASTAETLTRRIAPHATAKPVIASMTVLISKVVSQIVNSGTARPAMRIRSPSSAVTCKTINNRTAIAIATLPRVRRFAATAGSCTITLCSDRPICVSPATIKAAQHIKNRTIGVI